MSVCIDLKQKRKKNCNAKPTMHCCLVSLSWVNFGQNFRQIYPLLAYPTGNGQFFRFQVISNRMQSTALQLCHFQFRRCDERTAFLVYKSNTVLKSKNLWLHKRWVEKLNGRNFLKAEEMTFNPRHLKSEHHLYFVRHRKNWCKKSQKCSGRDVFKIKFEKKK